jgi:hypothetical protein
MPHDCGHTVVATRKQNTPLYQTRVLCVLTPEDQALLNTRVTRARRSPTRSDAASRRSPFAS